MSNEQETRSSKEISRESGQIGVRELSVASLSGLVGMIAMQPIFGVATILGVLDPIAFSGFANIVGYGLSFWGGVAIFVLGGVTVLPLSAARVGWGGTANASPGSGRRFRLLSRRATT